MLTCLQYISFIKKLKHAFPFSTLEKMKKKKIEKKKRTRNKIALCKQNVDLPCDISSLYPKNIQFFACISRLLSHSVAFWQCAWPVLCEATLFYILWMRMKSGEETWVPENRTGKALIIFRFNLPVFSFLLRRTFKSFCTSRLFIKDHLVTPFEYETDWLD